MIRGFRAYLLVDHKLTFREPLVLLFQFALPVGMYAFFGLIFGHVPEGDTPYDFYDDYTSNFVAIALLNVSLMGIATSLVIYKEFGFLKQLMITPLDTSAIWLSAMVKGLVTFLIGFAEIVVVGWLMFDKLPSNLLQMAVAIVLSAYCLFSLGFLLASICRAANTVYAAGGVLFQIMLLISGASIPLSQMPLGLQRAANVLPMTHVVDMLRLGWHGQFFTSAGWSPAIIGIRA